jgi:hypothetical protein
VDRNQWNQMWQQYATQLNGVLTPDQQQTWAQVIGQPFVFSPTVMLGSQQAPGVALENQQVVDPTVPKYFPDANAPQGTQPQPAPRQATNPGTPTPGGTTQGTQGGTVR